MNHTAPGHHTIDLTTWPRREHYEFFSAFEEPYYGVTVTIDCTSAYRYVKQQGISFHFYCLYQSLAAAQQVEAFRTRVEEDQIIVYDRIDAGAVVDRPDGTFGYGHVPYDENLETFLKNSATVATEIRATTGLPRTTANYLIRYSTLPWINFTALSHARAFSRQDTCPRITFGKMTAQSDTRSMPVSIHVSHAVCDGLQLGQYVEALQQAMNSR
ncbi:MAG: chloramphenicol acetyltransferase [Acidobacteriota bacterium]